MKSYFVQKFKSGATLLFVIFTLTGFTSQAFAKEKLTIVPNERVCMVTNMLFPRTQIPVAHKGKTYYGCCENCKKTLSEDPTSRTALDPVSGKSVDKATAVIAAREDGSVIYFESKKTFQTYRGNARSRRNN